MNLCAGDIPMLHEPDVLMPAPVKTIACFACLSHVAILTPAACTAMASACTSGGGCATPPVTDMVDGCLSGGNIKWWSFSSCWCCVVMCLSALCRIIVWACDRPHLPGHDDCKTRSQSVKSDSIAGRTG